MSHGAFLVTLKYQRSIQYVVHLKKSEVTLAEAQPNEQLRQLVVSNLFQKLHSFISYLFISESSVV